MIPLGVLGSARRASAAAPLSYVAAASGTTWPLSVDTGTPGASLYVVANIRSDPGRSITAVEVGGVAAELDYVATQSNNPFAFARITSPGGVASVTASLDGSSVYRVAVATWTGPAATFSAGGIGDTSATVAGVAGGFILAGNYVNNATAVTLTGVEERWNQQIAALNSRWAGGDALTSGGSVTVTTTGISNGGVAVAAYAV